MKAPVSESAKGVEGTREGQTMGAAEALSHRFFVPPATFFLPNQQDET